MDVVITYSKEPNGAIELRYTIRSLVKHLKGFTNLIIVGDDPGVLKDFHFIPVADQHRGNPARNIYSKILAACLDPKIGDSFLYASDDHFLLKDFAARYFPFFHNGALETSIKRYSEKRDFRHTLVNTYNALTEKNLPTIDYNIHCPIIYNKQKFVEYMLGYIWLIRHGYAAKSLYCNTIGVKGVKGNDKKIFHPNSKTGIYRRIKGHDVFSIDASSINDSMKEVWEELFPTSSRWEK